MTSKSGKGKDSSEIQNIDRPYMDSFRKLLNEYKDTLSTDATEIALGLGLNRSHVGEFINDERDELPLTRGRIISLYNQLIKTDKVEKKRRGNITSESESITDTRRKAIENRKALEKKGPDELLMEAGYRPSKAKTIITKSETQFSQLSVIKILLKDNSFNENLYTQIISNLRAQTIGSQPENMATIFDDLDWMSREDRDEVIKKYNNAGEHLTILDKSWEEKIGLLRSIMINEISGKKIELRIKIIRILREQISIQLEDINKQIDNNDFKRLWKENIEECEKILGKTKFDENPVVHTIVTCKVEDSDEETIDFEYISSGTHISAATSALSINMGFNHLMPDIKLDVENLVGKFNSLVKASVTLRIKDRSRDRFPLPSEAPSSIVSSIAGEWIGSDLFQAIPQAVIVAGRKYLSNTLSLISGNDYKKLESEYIRLIKENATIKSLFYKNRMAFDEYDFNLNIIDRESFETIAKRAANSINVVKELKNNYSEAGNIAIINNLSSSFKRVRLAALFYEIHRLCINSSFVLCKQKFQDLYQYIGEVSSSPDKKLLIPVKIALLAEGIFYNISSGCSISAKFQDKENEEYNLSELTELVKNKSVDILDILKHVDFLEWKDRQSDDVTFLKLLKEMESRIKNDMQEYIEKIKEYNAPGYDVYYSLGYYYSHIGRLLLYVGKNNDELKYACVCLLKSLLFFSRIGLSRKVERNLVLLGRVKVRMKNNDYLIQVKKLSTYLSEENLKNTNRPEDEKFKLTVESRLNLLEAESNIGEKGLEYALKALNGSLWLGLNRHIADNLWAISKCALQLENISIEEKLKTEFPELWNNKEDKSFHHFIHRPGVNKTAQKVVKMLFEVKIAADRSEDWRSVAVLFQKQAALIWNEWYKAVSSNPDTDAKHPFAIEILNNDFLGHI